MTDDSLDCATRFFRSRGIEPSVARFQESEFVIGCRIRTVDFELVYRVEGDQLIVCDFQPVAGGSDSNGAVMAFIRFIHQIERHVAQISSVRGMFLESLTDPVLAAERRRLASVLEAHGGVWRDVDGEPWLVYPMRAAQRKRGGETSPGNASVA